MIILLQYGSQETQDLFLSYYSTHGRVCSFRIWHPLDTFSLHSSPYWRIPRRNLSKHSEECIGPLRTSTANSLCDPSYDVCDATRECIAVNKSVPRSSAETAQPGCRKWRRVFSLFSAMVRSRA
mmetsp:Transcript_57759/g.87128  ORF Transcript_57759/g.87128 Transcript_57759/m.87128 type:complete len:124 (-) Transcript_57759:66-437(-)